MAIEARKLHTRRSFSHPSLDETRHSKKKEAPVWRGGELLPHYHELRNRSNDEMVLVRGRLEQPEDTDILLQSCLDGMGRILVTDVQHIYDRIGEL